MKHVIIKAITLYQKFISPITSAGACRFQPTCSQYMLDAIMIHGSFKGILLGLRRISQCRPHSKYSGFAPVPPKGFWQNHDDNIKPDLQKKAIK